MAVIYYEAAPPRFLCKGLRAVIVLEGPGGEGVECGPGSVG